MENENLEKKKRLETKATAYLAVAALLFGPLLTMLTTDKTKVTTVLFISIIVTFAVELILVFFCALILFPRDIKNPVTKVTKYNKIASLLMIAILFLFSFVSILFFISLWRNL